MENIFQIHLIIIPPFFCKRVAQSNTFTEQIWLFIVSASSFLLLLIVLKLSLHKQIGYKNLPPNPPSFLIIGHTHFMREPIHRRLQQLSDAYGSILNFSWGIRGVLLVSYPSAIEKCLSKNDLFFANRPRLFAGKYLGYGYTSIGAASYGPLWRNMHRVTTLEFFSTKRLNQFLDIRQDEVRLLLKNLYQSSSQSFIKVQMESKLSELSFNVIMRMIAGERYFGVEVDNPEEAKRFRNIIREIFYLSEASNLADFVQFLQWMDYQAYKKRIITVQKKAYGYMQNLIDEHRKKRNFPGEGGRTKTMIESILSL